MQPTYTNKLYRREDARRMARTLIDIRREQGEQLPAISTRRMASLPANVLAKYMARPTAYRSVQLTSVKDDVVVLKFSCEVH